MRELPEVLRIAEDVRDLCPEAWLINYINPTAVMGIGLMRHAPGVKSFALCDGHHMPHLKRAYLVSAGIAKDRESVTPEMESKLDLRIAGVNHFTWLLAATYAGRDILPVLRKDIERAAAKETADADSKAAFNRSYGLQLRDLFGAWPDTMGHTKEYVPYWQGKNVAPDPLPPLTVFDAAARQKRHDAMWQEIDDYLAGRIEPGRFMASYGPDHATDIVESMWGGLGKQFYINQPNRSAVTNMDDDAFLELLSDVSMSGLRPLHVGAFPPGIRALEQQVLETHELTAEAIVKCDRALLRRAMCLDPIVNSIADADAIIAELLEAERDALPSGWFAQGQR